ncbi:SDR family NAD(P)-dependent oxidoreductase [Fructilactobacillus frigidiflavus]|uniref:SDR family NAD(P)-dependent oxidoreductase n=1 Tax=Fructilactobacillus frigidiflavus TaxID=3242688 RepID=UPI003757FBFC
MNKNIVITGGTSGVGLAIAKDLLNYQDVNLILIGRSLQKGKLVKSQLGQRVKFLQSDLADPSQVKLVAEKIKQLVSKVDGLILCHGVYPVNATQNLQNNLLSHYKLVENLISVLQQSKILIVTGRPSAIKLLPICQQQNNTLEMIAWELTHKTLLMKFLANQFKASETIVNSFYPGDVKSNLMPYTRGLTENVVTIVSHLLFDEPYQKQTGRFYDNFGKEIELSNQYNDNQKLIDYLN